MKKMIPQGPMLGVMVLLCTVTTDVQAQTFYQYEVDGKIVFSDHPPMNQKAKKFRPKASYVVKHHDPLNHKSQWRILPSMQTILPIISKVAKKYEMDQHLIQAVVRTESNFNYKAVSRRGAQGLMQIMPQTGKSLGLKDPFDPEQNIDTGVRYLKYLLTRFKGDTSLALAAYNAGPTAVEKYKAIPPFAETQDYVSKIKKYYSKISQRSL